MLQQIHGDTIRTGIHSGQQFATFEEGLALWQRAEKLGYDWVSIFDHLRPPDRPDGPCFEGTTLLAALAARTNAVRCGMLVLGIPYRHPAVVASIAAGIDHISGGRLELGLGAGAPDLAQDQYGLPFPPVGDRMGMLDEACQIIRKLWTQEETTFKGKYYTLTGAQLIPKPIQQRLPVVLGGGGEQRMLRLVAKHADIWNTFVADYDLFRHKLGVLEQHCRDVGRDAGSIRKSMLFRVVVVGREEEKAGRLKELFGPECTRAPQGYLGIATPEQCIELLRPYVDLGVGDFLLGARAPFDWQTVELFAAEVAPQLRR